MGFQFDWDNRKHAANIRKHEVTFDEASTIFSDQFGMTIYDPAHSQAEERFIEMGLSSRGNLLVISYTERGKSVRIINARTANRAEAKRYEENKRRKQQES